MGSKGTSTQTAQQGTSSYTPNSQILGAGSQALGMASQAAQSPFQAPVAPVAGFSNDQQQAFQQTRDQQGMAQPYYNQAQGLFNQSAAPITAAQTNNYLNPYAGYVMQNLQEQQGQQMHDLTGKATQQAGGVGADRIGVAQGELARQQSLASGQTLSGIYGSALSAAQQDAQRQQSAAYGIGNLGGAAQNAAMQGTSALYGMGSQQQQLSQAQLNAPYQNQLAQIAFPYQNAQYLAGITGGLAGAMGGTTTSNQTGSSTPPQPSIWSQLLGGATGVAGLYGATNGFGGMFSNNSQPNTSAINNSMNTLNSGTGGDYYGPGFAEGGDTSGMPSWMEADPTIPDIAMHPTQVNQPKVQFAPPQQQSSGSSGGGIGDILGTVAKIAPMFLAQGGAVGTIPYQSYADGGDVFGEDNRAKAYALLKAGVGNQAPAAIPGGEAPPVVNPDQPYRLAGPEAMDNWRKAPVMGANDTSSAAPIAPPQPDAAIPEAAAPTEGSAYPAFGGSRAASDTAAANMKAMQGATYDAPYKDVDQNASNTSRDFARSPWTALMNAGFGMMAGTSPYAGVNIGKGLQQGVETLNKQREADREDVNVNQRAKQLAMQADQHLRQYTQLTPAAAATIENQKKQREVQTAQLEQAQWKLVYDPNSGKPYWTKAGEKAIPAIDGVPPPGPAETPSASAAPVAGTTPPSAASPISGPTGTNYTPPVALPPAPGRFNPTNGQLNPVAKAESIKVQNEARAASDSAAGMKLQLGQMEKDFQDYDKMKGVSGYLLQPGTAADFRIAVAKGLNGMFGGALIDPKTIGAAESISKLNVRLGQAQARLLGAREAAQVIQQSIKANPGLENTEVGRKTLLAQMGQAAQRQEDYARFVVDFSRANGGDATGAQQEFNRLNPPDKYVAAGQIAVLSPAVKATLPQAIEVLKHHANDPKAIEAFNKDYNNTADWYLSH